MADDLGANDVSYNTVDGVSDFHTPNIDRLAQSGIILSNYYTNAVCTPTRAALMTGRQAAESGLHVGVANPGTTEALPLGMPTLPEKLREGGYETFMGGKWHLGGASTAHTPIGRGFDDFMGGLEGHANFFTYDYLSGGFAAGCCCGEFDSDGACQCCADVGGNCCFETTTENGVDLWKGTSESNVLESIAADKQGTYYADLVTAYAVDKVRHAANSDKPVMLYVSYTAPHDPWQSPDAYSSLPECAAIANEGRRQLCGMMKVMDEGIGRIVKALQDARLDRNTIIAFSSDNGAAVTINYSEDERAGSNWPYRGGKASLFEGGNRVPGFIWGEPVHRGSAALDGGGLAYDPVFNVADWFLTLGQAAGVNPDAFPAALLAQESTVTDTPVQHPSSVSHWNALRELSADGAVSSPPRGPSQLMVYNAASVDFGPLTLNVGAVRNSEYKLINSMLLLHDGWFDPSNPAREEVICESTDECAASENGSPPRVALFKISEDPAERHVIPATTIADRLAFTDEQRAAYLELSAYFDYWIDIQAPAQGGISLAEEQFSCDATPIFHQCTWAPWLELPGYPLPAAPAAGNGTCAEGGGLADSECPSDRRDEWVQYAADYVNPFESGCELAFSEDAAQCQVDRTSMIAECVGNGGCDGICFSICRNAANQVWRTCYEHAVDTFEDCS